MIKKSKKRAGLQIGYLQNGNMVITTREMIPDYQELQDKVFWNDLYLHFLDDTVYIECSYTGEIYGYYRSIRENTLLQELNEKGKAELERLTGDIKQEVADELNTSKIEE